MHWDWVFSCPLSIRIGEAVTVLESWDAVLHMNMGRWGGIVVHVTLTAGRRAAKVQTQVVPTITLFRRTCSLPCLGLCTICIIYIFAVWTPALPANVPHVAHLQLG